MVDEHAGELVAGRLMDQHRRNRRIDPAAEPADHAPIADLLADLGNLGLAELCHRPVARKAADMAHEVCDQARTIRGMDHLGVKLGAVEFASLVRDHCERRTVTGGDDLEAGGKSGDLVAVAHPYLVSLADLPQPVE